MQKCVSEGDKTGGLGTKVPQLGSGAEPWWRSGGEAPKVEGNHCNNVLTKTPIFFFSAWEFLGGGHVPTSLYAPDCYHVMVNKDYH